MKSMKKGEQNAKTTAYGKKEIFAKDGWPFMDWHVHVLIFGACVSFAGTHPCYEAVRDMA